MRMMIFNMSHSVEARPYKSSQKSWGHGFTRCGLTLSWKTVVDGRQLPLNMEKEAKHLQISTVCNCALMNFILIVSHSHASCRYFYMHIDRHVCTHAPMHIHMYLYIIAGYPNPYMNVRMHIHIIRAHHCTSAFSFFNMMSTYVNTGCYKS